MVPPFEQYMNHHPWASSYSSTQREQRDSDRQYRESDIISPIEKGKMPELKQPRLGVLPHALLARMQDTSKDMSMWQDQKMGTDVLEVWRHRRYRRRISKVLWTHYTENVFFFLSESSVLIEIAYDIANRNLPRLH
jgi:hypothetical protein